jgi:hypothetical protein
VEPEGLLPCYREPCVDDKCMHNFSRNPEGKRLVGRPRCGCEDNMSIKMNVKDIAFANVDEFQSDSGWGPVVGFSIHSHEVLYS